MLSALLKAQRKRSDFRDKVIGALSLHYDFVNYNEKVARESATAGNVYDYLAKVLNCTNSTKFQQQVRELLVDEDIIKPVNSFGRIWLKGLVAKDPTEDNRIAQDVLDQHYRDRKVYRERQRALAQRQRNPNDP